MEPFVLFVSFVVVIQATINQFATPIRNLPINRADRSDFRSESSQSNDQSANSHSFVSMAACHVRQSRHVLSDSGNGRVQRARGNDSTQATATDRGLRLQPIVLTLFFNLDRVNSVIFAWLILRLLSSRRPSALAVVPLPRGFSTGMYGIVLQSRRACPWLPRNTTSAVRQSRFLPFRIRRRQSLCRRTKAVADRRSCWEPVLIGPQLSRLRVYLLATDFSSFCADVP